MASKMNNQPECNVTCRSQEHGSLITAAIIRGSDAEAIAYMKNLCYRCCTNIDKTGKTPLHTAASCGKKKVVEWLLANGVVVNQRDWESGYTALHRAMFYGHIDVALALIKAGGNLTTLDQDALSPLDHLMLDRPLIKQEEHKSHEVLYDSDEDPITNHKDVKEDIPLNAYVWGINNNYNLGLANQQPRQIPDFLEFFQHENKSITSVSLNKFHSMFLTNDGQVYGCGHEHGGRLGLETESSVIIPRRLKSLNNNIVKAVSAGLDHTLFLNEQGQVLSCGMNDFYQLGIIPPPKFITVPKPLSLHKGQSSLNFIGVGAGRFHSVVWTKDAVYTFGLNAGQLGHFKHENETKIIAPRKVTSISLTKGAVIDQVVVSDGAVVVATSQGNIYVLHQYQTRQAAKVLNIRKIVCIGGTLDDKVGARCLTSDGATELRFFVLDIVGHLYIWSEKLGSLRRCTFSLNREVLVSDICINKQIILICTNHGEGFKGIILENKVHKNLNKSVKTSFNNTNVDVYKNNSIIIKLIRLSNLHHAVSMFTDPKGLNFVALQRNPLSTLAELNYPKVSESLMEGDLSLLFEELFYSSMVPGADTIITAESKTIYAHSVILAQRSEYIKAMFYPHLDERKSKTKLEFDESKLIVIGNTPYELVFDMPFNLLKELVRYMYCGKINYKEISNLPCSNNNVSCTNNKKKTKMKSKSMNCKNNKKSAYSVYKTIDTSVEEEKNGYSEYFSQPMNYICKIGQRLGIPSIELSQLKSSNDIYSCKKQQLAFKRLEFEDLADISIICEDEEVVIAHKSILYARLEYFKAMLGSCWLEGSNQGTINIQFPSKLVQIVVDYLYEDESKIISRSNDIEFVCEAMVVADHFLVNRLKEICEERLSRLVMLKNVSDLLCFASHVNANQLCNFTMSIICQNICSLIESGALNNMHSDVLKKLSMFYREFIPSMNCRLITPYQCNPSSDSLEQILLSNPVQLPSSDDEWESDMIIGKDSNSILSNSSISSSSRRRRRQHRNSEGRTRKASTSSQLSSASDDLCKDLADEFESISFDDLEDLHEQNNRHSSISSNGVCHGKIETNNNLPSVQQTTSQTANLTAPINIPTSSTKSDFNKEIVTPKSCYNSPHDTPKKDEKRASPMLQQDSSVNEWLFPSLSNTVHSPFLPATSPQNKSVKVSKPVKLSQKQRKKLAAAQENINKTPSAPVKAWGIIEDNAALQNSGGLAAIMTSEKNILDSKTKAPVIVKTVSPACLSRSNSSQENVWSKVGDLQTSESVVPMMNVAASPNFSMILKEEKVHCDNLKKEMTKPLSMIQLEDKAIDELLRFYGADNNPEERISVARITTVVADPTWKRKS